MVPFLAPLLGSMAASLLPASFGTGIAATLGASGAAGGLLAAAAPKALGAGIGTLLAGGDMGDAALNAVGFGAAGAGGSALKSMMAGAPEAAASAAGTTGAGAGAAAPATQPMDAIKSIAQALGGGQQQQGAMPMAAPPMQQQQGTQASANPMLTAGAQPQPAVSQIAATTVPTAGGGSMMPAAVGIGSLPGMNNDTMLAGFSPAQRNMVSDYLGSQGMRGFA